MKRGTIWISIAVFLGFLWLNSANPVNDIDIPIQDRVTVSFLSYSKLSHGYQDEVDWPYKDCSGKMDYFKVIRVTLEEKPQKGLTNQVTVIGMARATFSSEILAISVKLNGIPIYKADEPVETEAIAGEQTSYSYGVLIPSYAPSGTYAVTLTLQDANKKELSCTEITFQL